MASIYGQLWMIMLLAIVIFMVFYATVFIRHDNTHIKSSYQQAALLAASLNSDNEVRGLFVCMFRDALSFVV